MTNYYAEGTFAIWSFEGDPTKDASLPAKFWTPQTDEWRDSPAQMAYDVTWSGDYYPIPQSAVPEMQRRCRELAQTRKNNGTP